MKSSNFYFILLSIIFSSFALKPAFAQNFGGGKVHGSFQMDGQYYNEDSLIEASQPDEKIGVNAFLNVIYTNNDFEAGIRYETYAPPILGFDPAYKGSGIAHKYIKYQLDNFEFTAGNFYEQFGSGMALRSYQEWNLGLDNSFNGFRVKYNSDILTIKGLVAKQRKFWDYSDGTVRAIDAEVSVNDLIKKFSDKKTRVRIGGSFVSRFQDDLDPIYNLPENVGLTAGRLSIFRGAFSFKSEFAYKINDPNGTNGMIYKNGHSALFVLSYSQKGFGFDVQAKRADNMDFRTDRFASGFVLPINYIPSITKQHAFSFPAMYPNATQANGETGAQATLYFNLKKNKDSKLNLGGKYGTKIEINYSIVKSIAKQNVNDTTLIGQAGTLGYKSDFFDIGDEKYYHDFNIHIKRKLSKKVKLELLYANIFYDMIINEGHFAPDLTANSFVADVWWKFKPYNSLHFETQALFSKQDDGDWASLMVEYKYKSFYAAVLDQYNYGNPDADKQIHYFMINTGYTYKSTRISIGYGKQRQGIICIGGVCREVPSSNGFNISLSSSF